MSDIPVEPDDSVEPIEIQTEMEQSFLEYAMSVIISRALPDARDGLKPVHRRILWSMFDSGHRPDRSHVKCATVVGDVIGKYHPHGDSAIYDSLVRMGQSFSLRHPLIDPHGNFGTPFEGPAAYRYTECRLTPLAMQMLADIDEDTVDFSDNFDGKYKEPDVLPSRFPNLLVNGSQGIAVGMATNIPPHKPGRGDRRHHPPDRQRRGHARRPDGVRQGPGLPDQRPDPGQRSASATPTAPARVPSASVPWPRSSKRRPAATRLWSPRSRISSRSR